MGGNDLTSKYKTIFNKAPNVMVQKGQKNSGKGKSVVIWSDLERLTDEVCPQLPCQGSVR